MERTMRYVLGLVVAASIWGITPASSQEMASGVSLASLENPVSARSSQNNDPERSTALIKEGESESPEIVAMIERNREDRERTVVIDR
jgi:hypothetical protein